MTTLTGNQIDLARVLTLRSMLKLEIRGMHRSRSPSAYSMLKKMGFTIVNVMDARGVSNYGMSINMVPVAPNVVVMPAGNPTVRALFEAHDIECHEVDITELSKGGGGVHCMTGVIHRDS